MFSFLFSNFLSLGRFAPGERTRQVRKGIERKKRNGVDVVNLIRKHVRIVRTPRGGDDFVLRDCRKKGTTWTIPDLVIGFPGSTSLPTRQPMSSRQKRNCVERREFRRFRKPVWLVQFLRYNSIEMLSNVTTCSRSFAKSSETIKNQFAINSSTGTDLPRWTARCSKRGAMLPWKDASRFSSDSLSKRMSDGSRRVLYKVFLVSLRAACVRAVCASNINRWKRRTAIDSSILQG